MNSLLAKKLCSRGRSTNDDPEGGSRKEATLESSGSMLEIHAMKTESSVAGKARKERKGCERAEGKPFQESKCRC